MVRDALDRLREPGASHRKVAAATGLSQTTVARIARGECDGVDGRLPTDPSPDEIRARCREIRLAGGGELVLPDVASNKDLAEDTAANAAYFEEHAVEAPIYSAAEFLENSAQRHVRGKLNSREG